MAGKVLSMEIGQGMTRVVEVDYQSKAPKIYNAFSIETPKDMVQDGVITRNEDFIINLKAELRKHDIRTDSIVFTVASSRIANREARIPLCKKSQILPLITQNAADYFPVDMNQYHLVYNILGNTEEDGVKQYRLSLLAVPNDVTTSYIDLARSLDMHIKAMDYVGNSIFQVVRQDLSTGVNAVIKIDEHTSLITVVKDGEIVLQRSIPHGVNGAIENVTELDVYGENLTYADATVVFTQQRCLRRYLNVDVDYQEAEDTSDELMMSRIMITENLRYFIGNVGRILEYFVSRNENAVIENIYLTGIGADFMGMDELLSNELGYSVKKYTGLDNIRIGSPNFNAQESMRVFAAAIGAAYNPLQLLSADLMKEEKQVSLVLPIAVFVACVLVAITLFLVGQISVSGAKAKNKEKLDRLERDEYLEKLNEAHIQAQETYNNIMVHFNDTKNDNRLLTQFISELEQKMPSGFRVMGIDADETDGVLISVECASKEEAALVFLQLRTFDTISIIASSDFTEEYGFTDEYKKLIEEANKKEIEKELDELEKELGEIPDVELEEKLEEKKDDIVKEKQEKKIALGRIIEDGEEDEDGINAADYFYTKVMFDVVALYNPTCDTNEAFMEGTNKALIEHRAEREEALKQRQAEKEAKKALEEDKN